MAGAGCLQQHAPSLNKWSKGAWCQILPSDKHSQCSLTSPQAASAYLEGSAWPTDVLFWLFCNSSAEMGFFLSEGKEFSATSQPAGR